MSSKTWGDLVDQIRTEHNGVFSVELHFGHDGHNVCRFLNYEKCLAEGDSGRSMEEAVQRCHQIWLLHTFDKDRLTDIVLKVAESQGCDSNARCREGFFFATHAFVDQVPELTRTTVETLLEQHPRIVAVESGVAFESQWFLLPHGMRRQMPESPKQSR